jgi:hypothetical protein
MHEEDFKSGCWQQPVLFFCALSQTRMLSCPVQGGAGPGGAASASGAGPNMSLDKHQLARLHAVLGPFMLRRVKADVVAEMVPKTEVGQTWCRAVPRRACPALLPPTIIWITFLSTSTVQ